MNFPLTDKLRPSLPALLAAAFLASAGWCSAASASPLPSPLPAAQHFSARPVAGALLGVDFHRSGRAGGLIALTLPASGTHPQIIESGTRLVIDLPGIKVPARWVRHVDVHDFGTPVQWFELTNRRHGARLTVANRGAWTQSVHTSGGKLVIDVSPATAARANTTLTSRYHGEKVSLIFQDIEVRRVLQLIGQVSKLNIIASDQVTGTISLNLHQVPWDEALDVILQSKGLAKRQIGGNVLWIAPVKEVASVEAQQAQAHQEISDSEPVTIETFHLKYQKAADVAQLLSAQSGAAAPAGSSAPGAAPAGNAMPTGGSRQLAFLSPRGSFAADQRTNTLIVSDTREHLQMVHDLLDKIDIPVRQVMIEARIVEANSDFSRNLGAKLALGGGTTHGATSIGVGGDLAGAGQNALGTLAGLADNLIVDMAAGPIGVPAGNLAVQIFHGASKTLGLELSALEADGTGKILSNPRLMTSDQHEATIEQGTEIPYTTAGGVGVPATTSFKKAVLSLKVKPQITPDNKILMDITVNKDSMGAQVLGAAGGAPAIDTKQIATKVLVANGDTLVIGGIYTQEDNNSVAKIPLLGDLPVLGNAFKTTSKVSNKKELLIFVTPRVVTEGQDSP
jgi:type IV pilus assembly protein PilQ